ncbi:MAG: hypothetical protein HFJ59_04995 [Clostridia bacterium]|nr:hypothetical protein [Clostridia bacterium]
MNFSSIVCKSLFIVNILVILNNISRTIQDKTNDQKNNIIKHLKIIIP